EVWARETLIPANGCRHEGNKIQKVELEQEAEQMERSTLFHFGLNGIKGLEHEVEQVERKKRRFPGSCCCGLS
ncbi:MAG: hypothetical protein ACKV22_28040, partial [Bryobacteraceae bacterium]